MITLGADYAHPLVIARDELDVSAVRAHVKAMHRLGPADRVPRSNGDVAAWHARQHHRYSSGIGHIHRGPFTLITAPHNPRGVGVIVRPLGNYTGQEPVTRAELRAEWLAAHPPKEKKDHA